MIKAAKNKILQKAESFFSRIPLLRDNTLQVNFIILLAAFTYIVITVDLQTEIALEKDEIAAFSAVLVHSFNSSLVDVPFDSYLNFPLLGFIAPVTADVIHNDLLHCLKDRAPPTSI
ncbi:hypothetical protein BH10BAC5_BH10BAC5_15770 [soil metagenome]